MSDNEADARYDSDGDDFNPSAHKKLIAGVNRLQKSQFIKTASRNEPALKRDEFNLVKPSSTIGSADARSKRSKVDVNDLVSVLDKTNKHLQLGKVLRKTVDKKKVLPIPLEKPAADKLQRAINYEKTKEKLERWDAVVTKNRSADHLSFPLNQGGSDLKIKDSAYLPSKFRIKSEMMLEMEQIEPQVFQMEKPTDEPDADEPKLTRDELIQRSRELRQLRIKESQRSAKAHHQNKIKSKKYHRILKREKMKQQIKEFELLQKTDPEAALRKIEQLDRSRVEERAMLRHRNTGTWAKNLQVRAKYDKDARKELADQIAISREMTAKKTIDESDDDDDNDADNNEMNGRDGNTDSDPFNPWIKVGGGGGTTNGNAKNNEVGEFLSGYRKYWQERNANEKDLAEYNADEPSTSRESNRNDDADEQIDESIAVHEPKTGKKTKKMSLKSKAIKKSKLNAGWLEEDITDAAPNATSMKRQKGSTKTDKISKKQKKIKTPLVDNIDDLFDDAEDAIRLKVQKKYEKLQTKMAANKKVNRKSSRSESDDDEDERNNNDERIDLSFKKQNKRPELDEALNGDDDANNGSALSKQITKAMNAMTSNGNAATAAASNGTALNGGDSENINPNDIAKIRPQHLSTALPDTIYSVADDGFNEYDDEYHFDEEKKLTIAEAFEDDDIVAEFKREKDDEEKKNGPQEIDLSMPGWGSWGGTGIDPTKRKTKRKLVLRFPAPEKRRVDNSGNLVIIENRDEKLQKHLVSNLPFPFTSVDDYEKSIRLPIGSDFVPATAHRLLTKPAVTTKSGTIIEPMNEQILIHKQKKRHTKTERRMAKTVS